MHNIINYLKIHSFFWEVLTKHAEQWKWNRAYSHFDFNGTNDATKIWQILERKENVSKT